MRNFVAPMVMSKTKEFVLLKYDPNDAEDKKVVDKLVADAVKAAGVKHAKELEDAIAAANVEHEENIAALKTKNVELTKLLSKAKKGIDNNEEVTRLEGELATTQEKLVIAEKAAKTNLKAAEKAAKDFETESGFNKKLLAENGLTQALGAVKVAPHFMDAVTALLGPKVQIVTEGDTRKAVIDGKPVADFVKEWSQGDQAKHYIAAPKNGGSDASGSKGGTGGKQMGRAAFDTMDMAGKAKFMAEGGTLTDG